MRQLLVILGAAAVVALVAAGLAGALSGSVPAPPANPTSADQIQNIDQVKTAIKGYYGDTPTTQLDPVDNAIDGRDKALHQFSPTSAYANEMAGIVSDAEKYLNNPPGSGNGKKFSGTKAILFDIDDTTLNTYSYEIYSNFVFNPTTNAAFVNACLTHRLRVPGRAGHGRPRARRGVARATRCSSSPAARRADDLSARHAREPDARGLRRRRRPTCTSRTHRRHRGSRSLRDRTPTCTTTQYKSLTRQHIESLGYDIVANFGDQFSDLNGGFADQTFKIPNPMYFLPLERRAAPACREAAGAATLL